MKIGVLFPGYGSQYVGMGKELYDEFRIVQEYFEEAANCLGINFVKLCFASSDVELGRIDHAYSAIFLVSASIYSLIKQEGIIPDVFAGYNNGEYAALFAAGGLNFPDGLYFLNKYTGFYKEYLEQDSYDVIKVTDIKSKELQALCESVSSSKVKASIAVYLSESTHFVSGHANAIASLRHAIDGIDKKKYSEIGPEMGLHSSLMDPVAEQTRVYLPKIDLKALRFPVISGVTAKEISSSDRVAALVMDNISKPIKWKQVLNRFVDCDVVICVGPGTFFNDLLLERYPDKKIIAINKRSDIDQLRAIVAG